MAERRKIIDHLKKEATNGGIILYRGDGKKAREKISHARDEYDIGRIKLLEHELPIHYRLLVSGSARIPQDSPDYIFTEELSYTVSKQFNIDVITGAGPGIMGAAIAGVHKARNEALEKGNNLKARNLGISIQTPWEEEIPDVDYFTKHGEMFTRIQELIDFSHAAYFGPGGIGTALELMMILQLKQTKHLEEDYPIIVHPFWKNWLQGLQQTTHDSYVAQEKRPLAEAKDFNVIYSENLPEIVGIIGTSYEKWNQEIGQHVKEKKKFLRR